MIRRRVNRRPVRLAIVAAAALCMTANAPAVGADQANRATDAVAERLEQPVTITWNGQALGSALERLAETQRLPLWIDRRVDPDVPVELSLRNRPLREALAEITNPRGWGTTAFANVLYIGPAQTAGELATLRAQARQSLAKLPPAARARWLRAEPWSFPRLSEPAALLTELAATADARVAELSAVPHDLWPARSLPAMPLVDRMVLVLAGFDLTCTISADGREVRVTPIERPVHMTSTYMVRRDQAAAVDALVAKLPHARPVRNGGKLTLAATVEQHEQVRAAIQGDRPPSPSRRASRTSAAAPAARRFTLKITNQPAGRVLDQLAEQLQLSVEWAPELTQPPASARDRAVSCDVREADLDGLLAAILGPAGLAARRDDEHIRIVPAQPDP